MTSADTTNERRPMQPLVAWRALRRLIADPEQTHEVFTVIRSLSGPALEKGYKRFRQTTAGANVLRNDIDLLDTLTNREALAALPANTLGRHYLNFMVGENLSADGLVDASTDAEFVGMSAGMQRFGTRQRDMHDLWHTLTQYGRDELGEACLLAFTYAQTKNRGIGVICLAGCLKLSQTYGRGVFKAAWRGYRDGKRAAWMPGQDWEHLLTRPVDEVREMLGIDQPAHYSDLRQAVAVAA